MNITSVIVNFSGLVTYTNGDKSSLQGGYDDICKESYSETLINEEGWNTTFQILWSDPIENSKWPGESYPWHNRLVRLIENISTHITDFAEIPTSTYVNKSINDMNLRLNVLCSCIPNTDWSGTELSFAALFQDGEVQIINTEEAELFGKALNDDTDVFTKFGTALASAMQRISLTTA